MRFNTEALLVFGNWFLLGATLYLMGSLGGELLYWQILNIPVSSIAPASHVSTSISPDQDQKRERFQIITDRNVFDAQKTEVYVPPPEPEPVPEQEEKAPEINDQIEPTKLQIALTGTMIYGKGSSFAFISQQSNLNQYNIYQIGDCFHPQTVKRDKECNEDSVKVLEITDRRVVILHRGKKQALWMQESKGFEASPKVRKNTVSKSSALIVPAPDKPKAVSKKKSSKKKKKKKNIRAPGIPDQNQRSFNFERIWVDEQLEQFDQLLMDARVVPTKKGEKTFFMFQFIKDESIYRKLGLQTNDIILEVNGYTVDSVAKALKLLEALQSEREISLKIEREGQPIDFSYFID